MSPTAIFKLPGQGLTLTRFLFSQSINDLIFNNLTLMTKNNTINEKNDAKYTYKEYYDMGLRIIKEDEEYVNKGQNENSVRFKGYNY